MKKKEKKDLPKVEPVHIKPLFGLKPGVWLTILYGLILILLIFFICFLPGIKNGGKRVTFTSDAYNAAVYLDDDYIGGTPFTRFVSSGKHTVSYKVNNVELDNFEIKVGHPVFMTWMFPRKQKINSTAKLSKEAFDTLTSEFISDLSTYSAILEYDSVFRYKPLFEDYVKSVLKSEFSSNLNSILELTASFITTDEMLEDFKNACNLANLNISASAVTPVVKRNAKTNKLSFSPADELEGIKGLNAGSFNVSQICITESQYRAFVSENPFWALANKQELIEQGLADEYYLKGVNLSSSVNSNKPVVNVSFYAAEAYCKWLSEKTGKTVLLPSEQNWMDCCASVLNTGIQKSITPAIIEGFPSALLGGVWEMTSTDYIPDGSMEDSAVYRLAVDCNASLECVIKGGSFVSSSVSLNDVGTASKKLCSDFMGFRVIWY